MNDDTCKKCHKSIHNPDKNYDAYKNAFLDCLRPLSDFMDALASGECPTLVTHFWKNPYKTARRAGLPWHACVLLGQGDWDEINDAVNAELQRKAHDGAGPIWVRAR